MKTTVPYGTSQWSTTKKFESKGQRENSKATEQCVSPTLLFWHSSGSSQLMGDGEHSNVLGGKSVGIPHGALLSKPRDKWWSLPAQRFSILGARVSARFVRPPNSHLDLPIDFLHVPKKWDSPPSQEEPGVDRTSQNVQQRLNRGFLYLGVSSK